MTSSFGWLDNDDEHRRRMLEVVELFREQGTIDELGIGSIRDTLSNAMFPGTSTLHTRLRYVLFLPWLMRQATSKRTPSEMAAEFRNLQYKLRDSLMAGGEDEGVMGNVAGRKLKRLPSDVYWTALGSWGLVDASSVDGFYRRHVDFRALRDRTAEADDSEARMTMPGDGIDAALPAAPERLLSEATFALTPAEEGYLSDHIRGHAKGTLLAWLVANEPGNAMDGDGAARFPWEIDNKEGLPDDLARLVDYSELFSNTVHGAALVYNLALARKAGWDEVATGHQEQLQVWQDEGGSSQAEAWDTDEWWQTVLTLNPSIRHATREFIQRWIEIAASGVDLTASKEAARLAEMRERQIKGARARFVNQSALDRWSGSSGLGRLDFRWANSVSHLRDLYAARAAA
ncbi:DUF6361 family protein [Demequina capsici]|uniref:DUF6361 family protein n=1 Tax=Demequina capsici TaxID=3075620 RepID=A0AA96F4E4_9MICO|nr:DUF6361 family protein [Demequina sp. OYTSA14]WNM23529.1 DUF6361 family protein [Demequina sp. OYTSA14]